MQSAEGVALEAPNPPLKVIHEEGLEESRKAESSASSVTLISPPKELPKDTKDRSQSKSDPQRVDDSEDISNQRAEEIAQLQAALAAAQAESEALREVLAERFQQQDAAVNTSTGNGQASSAAVEMIQAELDRATAMARREEEHRHTLEHELAAAR